jgi:hypothetical protein
MTCGPAPIPKRISVALGDNEMIRVGFVELACAPDIDVSVAMLSSTAVARAILCVFIKKLPQGLREEMVG